MTICNSIFRVMALFYKDYMDTSGKKKVDFNIII